MPERIYEKLILDPRIFRPRSEKIPKYIYTDGLNAIKEALNIAKDFSEKYSDSESNESEINMLKNIEKEITANMEI
jgi:hypothetical protein